MPEPKNYPDVILLTPHSEPILRNLFSYHSRVYDLNAYEAISPGAGQIMWGMYQKEEAHQAHMQDMYAKLEKRQALLPAGALDRLSNMVARLKTKALSPSDP